MKYVVYIFPYDQTIVFIAEDLVHITTRHPEAKLFETREEAEVFVSLQADRNGGTGVEEVEDEAEFRAREDTW